MRRLALVLVTTAAITAAVRAGGPGAMASAPASQPATTTRASGVLELPHIRVDLKARQVVLDAKVAEPTYGLEFLLCREGTKEYESLLSTQARAAHLHAALLALDLTPGKPARWSTGEEPAFLPPAGAKLKIEVRWRSADGVKSADVAQWLTNARGRRQAAPEAWVFIGSEVMPDGRYWADMPEQGGIISVANLASAVIDVPFASGQALENREFSANAQAMPPAGSAVEVVITPLKDQESAEHARALLEVDALGRMRLDGQAMQDEEITDWAGKFLQRHARGMVVIRCDGRAAVDDLRRAREALEFGGVREIRELHLPAEPALLPRTQAQADALAETMQTRLAQRGVYLMVVEPEDQIAALRRQLQAEVGGLDAQAEAWRQLAERLGRLLDQHPAPETGPAPAPAASTTGAGLKDSKP